METLLTIPSPVQYHLSIFRPHYPDFFHYSCPHCLGYKKIHTIKGYLCRISFAKLLTGCPGLTANHPQISLLMRGLLRQEPAQTPRRLPLTADLLSICIRTIRSGYGVPHIARTLEAMFLLAFSDSSDAPNSQHPRSSSSQAVMPAFPTSSSFPKTPWSST